MTSKTKDQDHGSGTDTKETSIKEYIYDDKLKQENPQEWQKLIAERTSHIQRTPVICYTPLQPRVTHISIQGWFYKT